MKKDVLTFEQFKEFADCQSSLEANWLSRLSQEMLLDEYEYPEFQIHQSRYLFLSLIDAEKYIRDSFIHMDYRYDTYRFLY